VIRKIDPTRYVSESWSERAMQEFIHRINRAVRGPEMRGGSPKQGKKLDREMRGFARRYPATI
jgi:hypothetical protein